MARRFDAGLETAIGGVLYFDWGWSESAMLLVEDLAGYGMLLAGVLVLVRPSWPVLLPVAAWFTALPLANWSRAEGYIPALEPIEHAARFAAPLALCVLEFWPPHLNFSLRRVGLAVWLLPRVGAGGQRRRTAGDPDVLDLAGAAFVKAIRQPAR